MDTNAIEILPLEEKVRARSLFRQNVMHFITTHTITTPPNLKVKKIMLNSDNYGYVSNEDEQIDAALAGTTIDYLTRLVICHDATAFDFLIERIHDPHLLRLIHKWKGYIKSGTTTIENLSIDKLRIAIEICTYEQQFRCGSIHRINPELESIDQATLNNFKIMLTRASNFFKRYGQPKVMDFSCAIGDDSIANDLFKLNHEDVNKMSGVIYGDGDYLSNTTLTDFKAYKNDEISSFWSRQILLYYMGLNETELAEHGVNKNDINFLVDYNPRYDRVFEFDLSMISEMELSDFTNQIMLLLSADTNEVRSLVAKTVENLKQRGVVTAETAENLRDPFKKYEDGIHEITREEYLNYYKLQWLQHNIKQFITCRWHGQYFIVKKGNFYMFFLKKKNLKSARMYYLDGGSIRKTEFDLEYYFDHLEEYAKRIKKYFSSYESALKQISNEIRLIGGTGRIHGCIVDIDFYNHVFLEPANGKLKIYCAESTGSRRIYNSLYSLLADPSTNSIVLFCENKYQRQLDHHDMLKKLIKYRNQINYLGGQQNKLIPAPDDYLTYLPNSTKDLDVKRQDFYDSEMYHKNLVLRKIQYIFDINTIRFWRDAIVHPATNNRLEKKTLPTW